VNKNNKLTVGGLCSGVGGIEYGFKKAGFEILWANDKDKYAMDTYMALHGHNHFIGKNPYKISKILNDNELKKELKPVDVLVAGFPCQPFSIAGYRKGFEDERGTVIEEIFDAVKILGRPKVLFLENVKNFRSHNRGKTCLQISKFLKEKLEYSVYDIILNTYLYTDIPQNRERTFIICFKNEPSFIRPEDNNEKNLFNSETPLTNHFLAKLPKEKKSAPKSIKQFLNNEYNDSDLYNDHHFKKYYEMLRSTFKQFDDETCYQIRRIYARKNAKGLCPTLTANMGTGGHNVPIVRQKIGRKKIWRRLTPQECFNLQGFPKTFKLPDQVPNGQLYKQAGNSVTIPLIAQLAKAISHTLLNCK
jgi:DNA (cytosine-5)-methyltransferase 1